MASTSYSAVEVLDLLDTDSSDSGSSGEEEQILVKTYPDTF